MMRKSSDLEYENFVNIMYFIHEHEYKVSLEDQDWNDDKLQN